MPNQRKDGKMKVGLWLTEQERDILKHASEKPGFSQSDLIKRGIQDAVKRLGLETNKPEGKV